MTLEPKENKQKKCMQYIQNSKLKNYVICKVLLTFYHVIPLYLKKKDADKRSHQIFKLPERLTPTRKI